MMPNEGGQSIRIWSYFFSRPLIISLKRNSLPGDEVRYIGIRAHDLQPVYDGTYQENLISCLHPELPEGLFEQVVLFRTAEQSDSLLWWKVGKEQWREAFVQKLPEQFYLPPEALMLLTEE